MSPGPAPVLTADDARSQMERHLSQLSWRERRRLRTALSRAADLVGPVLTSGGALLVGAGAGMGVDSGLPDYRSTNGLWRQGQGGRLSLEALSTPGAYEKHPELAWGATVNRLAAYRSTRPHVGYTVLRSWSEQTSAGMAVFTSNVDGVFARTLGDSPARDPLVEVHGSLERLQCMLGEGCIAGAASWPTAELEVEVEADELGQARASGALPRCVCGAPARPNVLMFYDALFHSQHLAAQEAALAAWFTNLSQASTPVLVLELGAGVEIPTVRRHQLRAALSLGVPLLRVNMDPDATEVPDGSVGLRAPAAAALVAIDDLVRS